MINKILFSIGSNLGNKKQNIDLAVQYLKLIGVSDIVQSAYYKTEPFLDISNNLGNIAQDCFLNIAAVGCTNLSPELLLFLCKSIEFALGRRNSKRWDARVIDIDLVLFGEVVVNSKSLTIPHLYLRKRRFVLVPAAEVAANMRDPISKKTILELLAKCEDKHSVESYF